MKIEKNNYRTFRQKAMYKFSNVKKISTLFLHRKLDIFGEKIYYAKGIERRLLRVGGVQAYSL